MLKAFKYRIYPTPEQAAKIDHSISVCRLVYNLALETKIYAYRSHGKNLTAFDLCYQLVDLKKEFPWIGQVDSQALQAAVKKIDKAFSGFFNGMGFPKFKSKKFHKSYHCPHEPKRIDWENSLLTIAKIKNIPIVVSRKFEGQIKTITISKTSANKYFSSILVDDGKDLPCKRTIEETTAVGIDVGLKHFAVLSDGKKVDNPKTLRSNLSRLKCLQRRLSRKKKGGKNRNKSRLKVALQYEKITNQRNDFLHKLSSAITKQYDTVCVENLSVKSMIRNPKLALSISDAGWGEFFRQLEYKQKWKGGNYLELPKFEASTKPCSKCGILNQTLTLCDREWACANCGEVHDRDHNAAINIKQYFFKGTGRQPGMACGVVGNDRSEEAGKVADTYLSYEEKVDI